MDSPEVLESYQCEVLFCAAQSSWHTTHVDALGYYIDPHETPQDPYIESATANPERVGNGCQIYQTNA